MRSAALELARLDERRLETLDAGAGTGFTTEGIVERVDAGLRDDARPEPASAPPRRAQAGARGVREGAGRRRGAAVPDRPLRPLRLRRLDRVLARTRARDRRGLPRAAARRGRARGRPGAARRPPRCAGWPSCGCCSRPSRSTATGSSARASRTSRSSPSRPDWYRDRRSRYAVAVERPQARRRAVAARLRAHRGPERADDLRRRLCSPGASCAGSLAGAVFVPVGVALACARGWRRAGDTGAVAVAARRRRVAARRAVALLAPAHGHRDDGQRRRPLR